MSNEIQRFLRAASELSRLSGHALAIFGGCARAAWAPPRATADVDILIAADGPDQVTPYAGPLGLIVNQGELTALAPADMTRFRVPEHPTGAVRMDIVVARHPFHRRVIGRAVEATVYGEPVRVARAEDIILLKLLAGRPRDLVDVDDILAAQGSRLDRRLLSDEAGKLDLELPPPLR